MWVQILPSAPFHRPTLSGGAGGPKERIIFADKELKGTVNFIDKKMDDVLHSKDGSDADYIRNLQTLTSLKNAAEEKIIED